MLVVQTILIYEYRIKLISRSEKLGLEQLNYFRGAKNYIVKVSYLEFSGKIKYSQIFLLLLHKFDLSSDQHRLIRNANTFCTFSVNFGSWLWLVQLSFIIASFFKVITQRNDLIVHTYINEPFWLLRINNYCTRLLFYLFP